MTAVLPLAIAQYAPGDDESKNRDEATAAVSAAAERGARLVLLPEYAQYFHPDLAEHAESHAQGLHGEFVTFLGSLATRHGVAVVAGFIERDADRLFNTVVAVGPDAQTLAQYRKVHLYDSFGAKESAWLQHGEPAQMPVFDFEGITFGIQTCYDLRFPESTRRLAVAGAECVLIPAEWVRGPMKEFQWLTLLAARAIENTVYVAATDHAPSVGAGQSTIIDPMGVTMANLGERHGVAIAHIESARLSEVREKNPSLALRRYDVTERTS
ncbi:carbon-nitrogen hydrolase family protein [Humidisolicoccus flavus]|uniref:carbon-nitrogen hydrolase family protein n=1 Tax=Humidisolicoccus flavus TaxID=3111414 RepID=UPI0032525777